MNQLPPIVGHLNGEPIYSVTAIPGPITTKCEADSDFPCLTCILNEMVPIAQKLNRRMEITYQKLLQLKEIRIDDNVTELHVKSTTDQLRMQLAIASATHDSINALLAIAVKNLA